MHEKSRTCYHFLGSSGNGDDLSTSHNDYDGLCFLVPELNNACRRGSNANRLVNRGKMVCMYLRFVLTIS